MHEIHHRILLWSASIKYILDLIFYAKLISTAGVMVVAVKGVEVVPATKTTLYIQQKPAIHT